MSPIYVFAQYDNHTNNLVLTRFIEAKKLQNGDVEYLVTGIGKSDIDIEKIRDDDKTIYESLFPKKYNYKYSFLNDSTLSIITDTTFKSSYLQRYLLRDKKYYIPEKIISQRISVNYDSSLYNKVLDEKINFPIRGGCKVYRYEIISNGKLKIILSSFMLNNKLLKEKHIGRQYTSNEYVSYTNGNFLTEFEDNTNDEKYEIDTDSTKISPERSASILKYSKDKQGYLFFSSYTSLCDAYEKYNMRILDSTFNVIWENETDIYGVYYPIVFDFQNDGIDEIVVFTEEHGRASIKVYSNNGL